MAATAATAIMAGSALSGAYAQSQAAKTQAEYSRYQSEQNARLAEAQAAEVEAQGEKEASRYTKKVRGIAGSQRAALAAQGISVDSGTAKDIQLETMKFGLEDVDTIRQNAIRQAYGYRFEATQSRAQGKFDFMAGKNEARNTLLTGGLQAASYGAESYSKYKKGTK